MKQEIKILVRESLVKLTENQFSDADKQAMEYVLGDNLNEANGREMYSKFLEVLGKAKKGLVSAAVITTLLTSSNALSAEIAKAPDNVKDAIEQVTQQSTDDSASISGDEKQGQDTFEVGKDGDSDFSINLGQSFESGSYKLKTEDVKNNLLELKNKIKELGLTSFDIVITASESQVPNQSGFGVGELAKKRGSVLKKVLEKFLAQNGLENVDVKVETRVGDVEWDGGNAHHAKYTKDQYVKLDVYASGVAPCELNFQATGEVATAEEGFISRQEDLDEGGSITIRPGSIPDRMVITASDGSIISDTGYFVDSQHNYPEFKYVPLYVANLSEALSNHSDLAATQGLESTTKSFNDFNELINFIKKDKRHDISKDKRKEVRNGIIKLKELWGNGQREFLFYKSMSGTVNYDVGENGSAKLTIYSPIGKTGYSVQGECN